MDKQYEWSLLKLKELIARIERLEAAMSDIKDTVDIHLVTNDYHITPFKNAGRVKK